jgi:hypothetical protein
MTMKQLVSTALLTTTLGLSAVPAMAVSPYSYYSASRYNTGGVTYYTIAPASGKFCFLARTRVEETDTGGEYASCEVKRNSISWVLEARLGKSSDADVSCAAYCYSY